MRALAAWHEEPISKTHDRQAFDCGTEALNDFLRRHARKAHDLGGAKTFMAIDDVDDKNILGFYSLSPAAVEYARTPDIAKRGLARHDVPGFRLARLAVHRELQGKGLGGQLLLAAGKRCLLAASEVGGVVMVIDAKNELVAGWYACYGAVPLLDAPLTLLLPLSTIETALRAAGKYLTPTRHGPQSIQAIQGDTPLNLRAWTARTTGTAGTAGSTSARSTAEHP